MREAEEEEGKCKEGMQDLAWEVNKEVQWEHRRTGAAVVVAEQ
jgi:hypothetical protein